MKPYTPTEDEPQIRVEHLVPEISGHEAWRIELWHEEPYDVFYSSEEAEAVKVRFANVIADRVHGDELADLRHRLELGIGLVRSFDQKFIEAGNAHNRQREWFRQLRTALIAELRDKNAYHFSPEMAVAFDRLSEDLDLPGCDARGVPDEMKPEPGYTPTLVRGDPGGYRVRWGDEDHQTQMYAHLADAAEHYRSCILLDKDRPW